MSSGYKTGFQAKPPFEEGDVIVDASGEAGFVRSHGGELAVLRQRATGLDDAIVPLAAIEYPVYVVARQGNPLVKQFVSLCQVNGAEARYLIADE